VRRLEVYFDGSGGLPAIVFECCGSITIEKDVYDQDSGGSDFQDDQDFTFSGDLGSFTLDDYITSTTTLNSVTFSSLGAGTYRIDEAPLPDDWDIRDISCSEDVNENSEWPIGATYVDVALDPCETVVCTFQNFPTGDPTALRISSFDARSTAGVGVVLPLGVGMVLAVGLAWAWWEWVGQRMGNE
jgi:hypothetical protein